MKETTVNFLFYTIFAAAVAIIIVKLTSTSLFFHHYLPRADVDEFIYIRIRITTCIYLKSEKKSLLKK